MKNLFRELFLGSLMLIINACEFLVQRNGQGLIERKI